MWTRSPQGRRGGDKTSHPVLKTIVFESLSFDRKNGESYFYDYTAIDSIEF